jgi:hypothetical protein
MIAPPIFTIELIITSDDPTGAPWPPDGSVSIVRRLKDGWTLWRRLSLKFSDDRAHARGSS